MRPPPKWRRHVVVVGYGRVGAPIGRALSEQGLPFIIVESNRWRAEELRAQGLPIVWGDAAARGVLEAAHVEHARLLVIATPDPFQGRRILELARRVNPRIDTVVRTHREGELSYLERQGVGMAVSLPALLTRIRAGGHGLRLHTRPAVSDERDGHLLAPRPSTPAGLCATAL